MKSVASSWGKAWPREQRPLQRQPIMALLSTCHQLYEELGDLPHSANKWLFEDMTSLLHHLSRIPTKFRKTIKDITLKAADWTQVEQQLDAIKQCSNLQRLTIKMPDTQYNSILAQFHTFDLDHNVPETIENVLRATGLKLFILEWHLERYLWGTPFDAWSYWGSTSLLPVCTRRTEIVRPPWVIPRR